MTTMAALLGGAAAGDRHRDRRGTAPAAGHRDRRRVDLQPDAHALHDAGGLPVSRPLAALVPGPDEHPIGELPPGLEVSHA